MFQYIYIYNNTGLMSDKSNSDAVCYYVKGFLTGFSLCTTLNIGTHYLYRQCFGFNMHWCTQVYTYELVRQK